MPATKHIKAISLFSGGLDSCLAAKILYRQGIEVVALYIDTPFTATLREGGKYLDNLQRRAEMVGAALDVQRVSKDYVSMVRAPKHGYGSNMNPCIDCKIYFYQLAYDMMKNVGAQFIATGEVVGQRPMTQSKQTMLLQERLAGVERLVVRPLTAKLLPPTIPEEQGWVDRERFYAIDGRSRRRQIALAKEFKIGDYAQPAGGCLLTDPTYSRRLKDLFDHPTPRHDELNDIALLKCGRHFRLSPTVKLIVGRNQLDNKFMAGIVQPGDILLEAIEHPGPLCLLRGAGAKEFVNLAGQVCKRYSEARSLAEVSVRVWQTDVEKPSFINVRENASEEKLKEILIN